MRAGALRPPSCSAPVVRSWLSFSFPSIEPRHFLCSRHLNRTSPKRSRPLSGAFAFPVRVFALALASATSIEPRQNAPWPFRVRFGLHPHVQGAAFAVAVALGGLEGSLAGFLARPERSGAGRQPTASAGTPIGRNSGSTNTIRRRNTRTTSATSPPPYHHTHTGALAGKQKNNKTTTCHSSAGAFAFVLCPASHPKE